MENGWIDPKIGLPEHGQKVHFVMFYGKHHPIEELSWTSFYTNLHKGDFWAYDDGSWAFRDDRHPVNSDMVMAWKPLMKPPVTDMGDWKRVSEELPEDGEEHLLCKCSETGDMWVAHFYDHGHKTEWTSHPYSDAHRVPDLWRRTSAPDL